MPTSGGLLRISGAINTYLTALQRNAKAVRAAPGEWMPWNFAAALLRVAEAGADA